MVSSEGARKDLEQTYHQAQDNIYRKQHGRTGTKKGVLGEPGQGETYSTLNKVTI